MKKLVLALALVAPFFAQADIIVCHYTEPFITTTYSMTQSTLTVENYGDQTKTVMKNISFQIVGSNQFQLWNKNKEVVQTMNLNFQGSDGMSDLTYPYDSYFTAGPGGNLGGGCTSNFLKATGQN
jgi:hypothetical protein